MCRAWLGLCYLLSHRQGETGTATGDAPVISVPLGTHTCDLCAPHTHSCDLCSHHTHTPVTSVPLTHTPVASAPLTHTPVTSAPLLHTCDLRAPHTHTCGLRSPPARLWPPLPSRAPVASAPLPRACGLLSPPARLWPLRGLSQRREGAAVLTQPNRPCSPCPERGRLRARAEAGMGADFGEQPISRRRRSGSPLKSTPPVHASSDLFHLHWFALTSCC